MSICLSLDLPEYVVRRKHPAFSIRTVYPYETWIQGSLPDVYLPDLLLESYACLVYVTCAVEVFPVGIPDEDPVGFPS